MTSNTEAEINKIQQGFENIDAIPIESPDQLLRNKLLNFVSGQVSEINKLDRVIALSLKNLEERLEKNEIAPSDVLTIINTLANKKVDLTTAILEPFKAAPGGTNVLLPPPKESSDQTDFQRGLQNMSSDDLKLIEKLIQAAKQ